ncbi:MAG: Ig-like domain repeat protein, partial [Actinomycetia bacterium]|nr:Ig-like domain repeat protein [Actinomycetes bacterium]
MFRSSIAPSLIRSFSLLGAACRRRNLKIIIIALCLFLLSQVAWAEKVLIQAQVPFFTAITYSGDTMSRRYETATLRADLTATNGAPDDISGKPVVFTLSDGVVTQTAGAFTNSSGRAETFASIELPIGIYDIGVAFAGDSEFTASSSPTVPFVVWEPDPGININGAGWLEKNGSRISFGLAATYRKNSPVAVGRLQLFDHGTRKRIRLESFTWLVPIADNVTMLRGLASVNGESGH